MRNRKFGKLSSNTSNSAPLFSTARGNFRTLANSHPPNSPTAVACSPALYDLKYTPSRFDDVEDQEMYIPNGFHPVSIGDSLNNGRYKILHKLGSGGSSTVWLARDQLQENITSSSASLVTLKILTAELYSKYEFENPEIIITGKLGEILRDSAGDIVDRNSIQVIKDSFVEKGPNGDHLCLIYQLAGPSVQSMSICQGTGKEPRNRRLRADLARKVAKQVATLVQIMHTAGFVHGGDSDIFTLYHEAFETMSYSDLTPSNVLFQVSDRIYEWSDEEVYINLGIPRTDKVKYSDGSPPGPSAPQEIVEHLKSTRLYDLFLTQEDIVLIDFGQAVSIRSPSKDYRPATALHYYPPETHFEDVYSPASDIWELACLIYEVRAGLALFDPFFSNPNYILKQIVQTLGKLPEPWWDAFDRHRLWFDENGEPKSRDILKNEETLFPALRTSIREELQKIGVGDTSPESDDGPMIEPTGTRLAVDEVSLLGDLLERMLKYRAEDRISIQEVIQHPWFEYKSTIQ